LQMTGNRICSQLGIQCNLMSSLFWDVLSTTIYQVLEVLLVLTSNLGPEPNPRAHMMVHSNLLLPKDGC
jgi:hypothetical protein